MNLLRALFVNNDTSPQNEVEHTVAIDPKESNPQENLYLLDRNSIQFVVDRKFSLRLDEVI